MPNPRAARGKKSLLAFLGLPSGRHEKRPACAGVRGLTTRSPGLQATTVLNSVCAKGRVFGYPDEERYPRDEEQALPEDCVILDLPEGLRLNLLGLIVQI
jgi:hypothetical protein